MLAHNINAYYLIVILSIYFSVNLLSFFASNFILFQNDTKLYCQRQFVRRRNRPTDQTRFQHGFNSWDFYSESSWRRHCEQNWFQKWQTLWVKATKISACYWKTKHNLVFTSSWFHMIKRTAKNTSRNFSILPLFGTNFVHFALVTGVQITNIKKCEQHEFIYCWIVDIHM